MACYLVSDIHGTLNKLIGIMKTAKVIFPEDTMYVLGDALDRGEKSMETLLYIWDLMKSYPDRVFMIKGNHEYFAQMYLEGKVSKAVYSAWGGESTYRQIDSQTDQFKAELLDFIKGLPLYHVINTPDRGRTVLCHAGLWADSLIKDENGKIDITKSLDKGFIKDPFKSIVTKDIFYLPHGEISNMDGYIIMGHQPTFRVNPDGEKYILKNDYFMDIDCGAGHPRKNGKLAMYCVDTQNEYYI